VTESAREHFPFPVSSFVDESVFTRVVTVAFPVSHDVAKRQRADPLLDVHQRFNVVNVGGIGAFSASMRP